MRLGRIGGSPGRIGLPFFGVCVSFFGVFLFLVILTGNEKENQHSTKSLFKGTRRREVNMCVCLFGGTLFFGFQGAPKGNHHFSGLNNTPKQSYGDLGNPQVHNFSLWGTFLGRHLNRNRVVGSRGLSPLP